MRDPLSRTAAAGVAFTILSLPAGVPRATQAAQPASSANPAAFFQPAVTLERSELARLSAGEVVVKVVPARGTEVAIFSAARVGEGVDGDRLVAWVRRIADLKKSSYVPAIARFSDPPRLEDLARLTLDDDDLDAIRACRPGDCDIKLSDLEIAQLQRTVSQSGAGWKAAALEAYRAAILARVQTYLSAGLEGTPSYFDQRPAVALDEEFAAVLANSGFLPARLPTLADHLIRFPRAASPSVESFLYWSKESLGAKPVISVTHVNIVRNTAVDLPSAVVAAKQVYASHYMTGALAVTIIDGRPGSPRYLAYLNRSRVDVLDGFFGGLVRTIMSRRLRSEAGQVIRGLRERLESGPPPVKSD